MPWIGPKEHFWEYMGYDTHLKGEWSYCDRCGKYRFDGKVVLKSKYKESLKNGWIEIR